MVSSQLHGALPQEFDEDSDSVAEVRVEVEPVDLPMPELEEVTDHGFERHVNGVRCGPLDVSGRLTASKIFGSRLEDFNLLQPLVGQIHHVNNETLLGPAIFLRWQRCRATMAKHFIEALAQTALHIAADFSLNSGKMRTISASGWRSLFVMGRDRNFNLTVLRVALLAQMSQRG